jgi:hypothetical protein
VKSPLAALACAFVAFAVACGGAQKKTEPMVADPAPGESTPGTEDSPSADGDADGGASGGSSAGGENGGGGGGTTASGGADVRAQGDEEGAQALLRQFVAPNANHLELTKSLRPTTSDYKAMFDAATAAKVEASQSKDWDSNKAVVKPKPNQTEVKLWSASGSDLAQGKGNAKEFPTEYKKVAKHLAPTVLFYRFKFVESGKDQGTAYDGLAFVNGRWVIAPKPWRAIDGGDDAKPKPKGKGKGKRK